MADICVSSHHGSLDELLADDEFRELARRDGFLVELRLDQYAGLSLEAFRYAVQTLTPTRLVVTFRAPVEGGKNLHAEDAQRISYLSAAARLGVAYVDIELSTLYVNKLLFNPLVAARGKQSAPKFIFSYHDFVGMPTHEALSDLRSMAEKLGADVVKLAVYANGIEHSRPLLLLLCEETGWTKPLIGIAMGEAGFWSRVLGPTFPCAAPFGFARSPRSNGTAPGQPTWSELDDLYRFRKLKPGAPVYGVMGNPIAHSRSPAMHNAALQALDLPGVYLPFKVEGAAVPFVREMAPRLGVRGLSVTIPHKEAVLETCAESTPLVKQIGAANTMVVSATRLTEDEGLGTQSLHTDWFAANTDAQAAAWSLEAALGGSGCLNGKSVLIVGAGGAARAVAFGVKALGAEVLLYNRTVERAEKLAYAVGGRCVSRAELRASHFRPVAVVNTTPVGMAPKIEDSPLEKEELPEGSLIFDTVYNPLRTKLLRLAEERGLKTLNGLAMFVGQGAAQFELFTGKPAPRQVMEEAAQKALSDF